LLSIGIPIPALPLQLEPGRPGPASLKQIVVLFVFLINSIWNWLHRIGGPGLILLGIVDSSAIPLPGSMDVFVILLSSHRREWWPYYAFMATA
jgi:hypothetical protein